MYVIPFEVLTLPRGAIWGPGGSLVVLGGLAGGLLGSLQGSFFDPRKTGPGVELPRPPGSPSGGGRGVLGWSWGGPWGVRGVLGGSFGFTPGPVFRPPKNGPWSGAPEAAGGPVGGVGGVLGVSPGGSWGASGALGTQFGADLWSRSVQNHLRPLPR